jgi:ribosomal protein S18 acetylase RimI-like enzyme
MLVRPIHDDEHAAAGDLIVRAFRDLPETVGLDEYEATLRDVAGRVASAEILVATDGDHTVLGCVTYVHGPGPLAETDAPDDATIRMLAVDPSAQGRGVGRALVDACLARARDAGVRRVVLRTRRVMIAAHHLYESLGFRREPSHDEIVPGDVELLGYVLELDAGT